MDKEQNERTTEATRNAKKDFAQDLPLLVDETARDVKNTYLGARITSKGITSKFNVLRLGMSMTELSMTEHDLALDVIH